MKHVPLEFWKTWNDELRSAGSGFLLGELLDGDPSMVANTWVGGGFDGMFDFPLGFAMADVFCRGESPSKLAAMLSNDRRYPDPQSLVTLLDNHDLPRIMSVCGGDVTRVRSALSFLLVMRGIPSLSWGTEVGLDGMNEPDNRKSMQFVDHALSKDIGFWLEARRRNPALSEGVPVILSASLDRVFLGRVSPDQLALIEVGQPRERRAHEMPEWPGNDADFSALAPPGAPSTVRVSLTAIQSGRFAALFERSNRQWRTGRERVQVNFEGPPGSLMVGSGPEMGDWNAARALPLPVSLELPRGAAFEFKAIRRERGTVSWATGPNNVLFVEQPVTVTLNPRY